MIQIGSSAVDSNHQLNQCNDGPILGDVDQSQASGEGKDEVQRSVVDDGARDDAEEDKGEDTVGTQMRQ
jgi:hypothetical protein